jgi:hypothetical protein
MLPQGLASLPPLSQSSIHIVPENTGRECEAICQKAKPKMDLATGELSKTRKQIHNRMSQKEVEGCGMAESKPTSQSCGNKGLKEELM